MCSKKKKTYLGRVYIGENLLELESILKSYFTKNNFET